MKRLFALPAVLLAVVIIALFVVPYVVPPSVLQRHVAPLLQEQAGIELTSLKRIQLAFYPEFGVGIDDAQGTIARAGRADAELTAKRIVLSFEHASLLQGRFELRKIRFEAPDLIVRNNLIDLAESGRLLLIRAAARPSSSTIRLPRLDADIVGGSLQFQDRSGQTLARLVNLTLAMRHDFAAGSLIVDGDFNFRGERFGLEALMSPDGNRQGRGHDLSAELSSPGLSLTLDGSVTLTDTLQFQGGMLAAVESYKRLAAWSGGSPELFQRLSGANLTGKLSANGQTLEISNARLLAPGIDGRLGFMLAYGDRLKAEITRAQVYGGRLEGSFALDRRASGTHIASVFDIAGVDSLALGRGISGFDWLSGPITSSWTISGSGRSGADILRSLAGKMAFSVNDGAIEGVDFPLIISEAKGGEFGKWERDPNFRTPFDVMQATFEIEKGVGKTSDLRLIGPGVSVTGKGQTDFARQRLRYNLQTRISLRSAAQAPGTNDKNAQFAMPLIVNGNWAEPDIYPDLTKMLRDPNSVSGMTDLLRNSLQSLTEGNSGAQELIDGLLQDGKTEKPAAGQDQTD